MNKQEFVEDLAERCELSKAEAGRTLDAILDSLTDVMTEGEEVSFTGFGKFFRQRRQAREGVNPQDPSKKIKIAAANVPKFRPGASLRAAVAKDTGDTGPASGSGNGPAPSAETTEWKPLGSR